MPLTSWNRGPVFAISIGFYPDAWAKLTGIAPLGISNKTISDVPEPLASITRTCACARDTMTFWEAFCDALEPHWQLAQRGGGIPAWTGKNRIANWAKSLVARAAVSGPGIRLRATERRLRRWAGQSRQSLSFYADVENLHRLAVQDGTEQLAGIAYDAGFSDQSHTEEAEYANSPSDRRRQIPSIMKSLRKWR